MANFKECNTDTLRCSLHLFLAGITIHLVASNFSFLDVSLNEQGPDWIFLTGLHCLTFDIYLSQIVKKCAHVPKIISLFFFFLLIS